MNYVYLSPHFPPNFYLFAVNLRLEGVNVVGVGDEPHDALRPELREALSEYYRVGSMEDSNQMVRALGHLTHQHGKLQRVESHNEHWLFLEAQLREDFNIVGPKIADTETLRSKARMKEVFRKAGLAVARGRVCETAADALLLAKETGYPLVAKPDMGVGAIGARKMRQEQDITDFFASKDDAPYIFEEFIPGKIVSYDGLTDRNGNIAFDNSFRYSSGVMEVVTDAKDVFYYSVREIPADLRKAGTAAVKGFGLREKFFHLEFFRTDDGGLVALEMNARPPGGYSLDMFNYGNDIDIYREYARIIAGRSFKGEPTRAHHACYCSRRYSTPYALSHEDIMARHGEHISFERPMPPIFSAAMGDHGYILRVADESQMLEIAQDIHQQA